MSLYQRSALYAAIRLNDSLTVQWLISTKLARLSADGTDFHLLRKSIEYNRPKITKLLLDHGCRVSLPSFVGDSALHLAVAKPKCYSLVKRLLQCGANVNQRNRWNETPIHVAFASSGDNRVVNLLLKAHLRKSSLNETNDLGLSYLHIASATADVECVRKLVEEGGADVNAQVTEDCSSPHAGSTPLHIAVQFGKIDVIHYLLEQGANVYTADGDGSTAIHLALELEETDIVELLFEYDHRRINVCNDRNLSHFMAACACSGLEYAQDILSDQFFNVNEVVDAPENPEYFLKGFTPLHFAAMFGRLDTARFLLSKGADCCATTSCNITPSQLAATNNEHQDVVDLIGARCRGYDLFSES